MKSKKFAIAGDNHGDMIDPAMDALFFDWMKDYKPEVCIHAGDVFDFRPLRNGASPEEKQESMKADFDAGMSFLRRFFAGSSERHLLLGNHDWRLWELRHSSNGALRDLAEQQVKAIEKELRGLRVKYYPYDSRHGVLRIGHLQVIHGFKAGVGAAAAHARIYRNVIFGHTHCQSVTPVESLDGPMLAMGTGCLCQIDMPYNARQTNKLRHQQGWVYGLLHDDGTYNAYQAKRIGDTIHAASSFKEYKA